MHVNLIGLCNSNVPQRAPNFPPILARIPLSSSFNELALIPLKGTEVPIPPVTYRPFKVVLDFKDTSITTYEQISGNWGDKQFWKVRGKTWAAFSGPTLLELWEAGKPLPSDLPQETVPLGSVVEVIIQSNDGYQHPLHMHGHNIWVVDSFPKNQTTPSLPTRPVLQGDTFLVTSTMAFRFIFVADNPGVWIFHCHIDWHLLEGMAMVFVTK
jgi:hypothetical protein